MQHLHHNANNDNNNKQLFCYIIKHVTLCQFQWSDSTYLLDWNFCHSWKGCEHSHKLFWKTEQVFYWTNWEKQENSSRIVSLLRFELKISQMWSRSNTLILLMKKTKRKIIYFKIPKMNLKEMTRFLVLSGLFNEKTWSLLTELVGPLTYLIKMTVSGMQCHVGITTVMMKYVHLKLRSTWMGPHSAITQKAVIFIFGAMSTWNLKTYLMSIIPGDYKSIQSHCFKTCP